MYVHIPKLSFRERKNSNYKNKSKNSNDSETKNIDLIISFCKVFIYLFDWPPYLQEWGRGGSAAPDTPCSGRSSLPRRWYPRKNISEFFRTLAPRPRYPAAPGSLGCWGSYTDSAGGRCPTRCLYYSDGGTCCTHIPGTPSPEPPPPHKTNTGRSYLSKTKSPIIRIRRTNLNVN